MSAGDVQIIRSNQATDDGYDGTEGYVIEHDGVFVSQHETLADAFDAVQWAGQPDPVADYHGRTTWTVPSRA